MDLREQVIAEIRKIYDPEIPVNIYELGLIYDVKVNESKAKIIMTLTTPNCPVAESLPQEVKDSAMQVEGIEEVEVKEIVNDFLGMIKENPELKSKNLKEDEKTKLMCLSGVKQYPMRVKCATLSWHTLISAIDNTQEEINTEKLD